MTERNKFGKGSYEQKIMECIVDGYKWSGKNKAGNLLQN